MHKHKLRNPDRSRQSGAVLYVALIMLILLALIGIVGMQVTGMQERMSSNYANINIAFQNAEARARQMEASIQTALTGAGGVFATSQETCAPTYDPLTWANNLPDTASDETFTRRLDKCFPASSVKMGAKQNEETGNIYQITAFRTAGDGTNAVVDTVFVP